MSFQSVSKTGSSDVANLTPRGSLYQTEAAATMKAQSPIEERRLAGISPDYHLRPPEHRSVDSASRSHNCADVTHDHASPTVAQRSVSSSTQLFLFDYIYRPTDDDATELGVQQSA